MLQQVRDLNVRAVTVHPELLEVVFADLATNASPALVRELLPRLARIELRAGAEPRTAPVPDAKASTEAAEPAR